MSFLEQRLNDGLIIYDTVGGPEWSTDVVTVASGYEHRNANWAQMRGRWELGERRVTQAELDALLDFFTIAKGRANGFRLLVRGDYEATVSNGRLGTGAVGTGLAAYDLYRRRSLGGDMHDRRIVKPASVTVYRGGVAVTAGVNPGNVGIDLTTGVVTFVADDSEAITGHTVGAAHQFTTAADMTMLAVGEKVYLSGITGTAAAVLNGVAHTISNKTGAGPYTWTIATATTGLTVTANGTAYAYPQAGETLTWAGQFDTPVRFDADQLRYRYEADDQAGRRLYWLSSLPVVEIRL